MTNSNMTCEEFDAALPDHLEGTLGGSLRSAVEGHLRECVRCAGLVRDLRNIETEASKLPDLVASRDLWQGIEARIAAPVIPLAARPERQRRIAPTWIGIAAAALIVTTAGITYTLTARSFRASAPAVATFIPGSSQTSGGDASTPDNGVAEAPTQGSSEQLAPSSGAVAGRRITNGTQRQPSASLASATQGPSEAVYTREITMLQKIVSERRTQLDSTTIAIIERNLQIIDRAIEQSKAALARDPASRLLGEQLTHALDKKVELLRTAAMLPANT